MEILHHMDGREIQSRANFAGFAMGFVTGELPGRSSFAESAVFHTYAVERSTSNMQLSH